MPKNTLNKTAATLAAFTLAATALFTPAPARAGMFDDFMGTLQGGVDSAATSVLGAAPEARIVQSTGFLDKRNKIPVACYKGSDTPVLTGGENPISKALSMGSSCKTLEASGQVKPIGGAATAAGSNAGNSVVPGQLVLTPMEKCGIRTYRVPANTDPQSGIIICMESRDPRSVDVSPPKALYRLNVKTNEITPIQKGDNPERELWDRLNPTNDPVQAWDRLNQSTSQTPATPLRNTAPTQNPTGAGALSNAMIP